ncbi:ATP-binding protein [Acinetobacter sp. YH12098]|uniref:ATP-binding protein n=1 Tax=Acinetobacter sp. YH12098 TaxID=2601087 RepID=UPI0015D0FA85|nr:ATP-binding protein [Acinetobacter sp. YH12098]
MSIINPQETSMKGLQSIILYDSFLSSKLFRVDISGGHTNITGINGAGKTSFLNLIPIFFGASPNGLIEKAANKKNFVDYYLPSSRSMVIFEYLAHSGTKCVVLYRNNNQGKHNYRFVDGCAEDTLLSESSLEILGLSQNVKDVFDQVYKSGVDVSRQIDSIPEYIYTLTADKSRLTGERNLRDLCNRYSLSGSKQQLKFLSNLTQVTINQNNVVSNFKTMLIEAYLDNEKIKTKPTSTADWLATINDVKALQSLQSEKQKIISGIQLKNAVLASFNALHAHLLVLRDHVVNYEQQISSIEHEIYAVKNKGNETVRNLNNQIVQVKELIAVKEKSAGNFKQAIHDIEVAERRYQDMNISVMEQEYKKRAHYFNEIEEAKKYKQFLTESYENINREYDKHSADLLREKMASSEALNAESNEVQEAINQLRNRFDLKVKELERKQAEQLQILDQEISSERQRLLDIQSAAMERMHQSTLFTDEENLQLQRLKLAYEVKDNTLSAKSDELKAAQNKLKQLNFDQNKAQYDLNGLKAKLEKAKQSEENLRTTLFQKDTLLRFLNDAPNEDVDWRTTIAKVINPELFFKTNLNPVWQTGVNANALSLYGLEIDLNKLEIPGEADSLEQLQIRLKDAEIYTASLVEQYDKQSHLAQSIHREINETNIAVVKLENELNTLQNEKQQARQVYDQTEKELKAKKAEATRIEQEAVNRAKYELQTFNNQIEPKKRGELRSANMLEKNGLKESYDASYADLRIKLDLIATKEKQLESSYQAKMDDLTNLYHSKLREQGVDENILKQAEMKIKAAIAQHTKVKGYESILAEYDMWKKNHYQYKQNHIEDMNQALKLVSEYSHNLSKLESELEQVRTSLRTRVDNLEASAQDFREKIKKLDKQGREIENLFDDDILLVEVDRPEFLSFDSFSRDLGTLADTQKKQIYQLRLQTNASKALLRKYEAFSLFKLFEEKMESMGTTSETMNTINSMSTIESIMDYDLPKKHDAVTNIFRNKSAQLRNYIQEILNLNKRLKSVSTELSGYLNRSNKFKAFTDFSMNLESVLNDKNTLDQLNQFVLQCEDYQSFENMQSSSIPSEDFIRCCEYTLKAIESTKGHTDDIRSMVRLKMSVMNNGRLAELRTDNDFTSAGSTGTSRILVLIMFLALSRKLCPDNSTYIHIPLDEIGNFDAINTNLLFDMMDHNKIYLVCAQPENSTSNHKFKNLYIVGANGVSTVVPLEIEGDNPLLAAEPV